MKTDNVHLFEYSVVSLSSYGYKIIDLSLDLHSKEDYNNIMTEYEKKFAKKGCKIYMLSAVYYK
jgi:tRNA (guanine-N7-)-methyltransferase